MSFLISQSAEKQDKGEMIVNENYHYHVHFILNGEHLLTECCGTTDETVAIQTAIHRIISESPESRFDMMVALLSGALDIQPVKMDNKITDFVNSVFQTIQGL